MIDYEKLKIAHDLVYKAAKERGNIIAIQVMINYDGVINYTLKGFLIDEQCYSIDVLIEKLKKITKKHPKYKTGQLVWRLNDEYEPKSFLITGFEDGLYLDGNESGLILSGWEESQLYETKDDLINAQINYWQSLKGV